MAITLTIDPRDLDALTQAAQEAQDAALADSNDDEIEKLRDALEQALGLLGLKLPEGREACDECGTPADLDYGMCPSCLHDALRSGWEPGK